MFGRSDCKIIKISEAGLLLLLTVLRRYFRCGFICFMFSATQFLNVLILTLLCVLLFNLVQLTELPPEWERAANSAYHLLFRYLLRYVCSFFPLMFRTSFGFLFGQFLKYLNLFIFHVVRLSFYQYI